ncbi:MAG: adenylyltransferase/cytidyltransferase family protein, partial [Bacteroidota bacterium]
MKHSEILQRKIMTAGDMAKEIFRWKFKSKTVAFTNGCFDILHLGHIDYLAKAADEADYLIVGVNTDESVRRLKGPHRPINGQEQRSRLLAALHCVAGVVLFEEDTPLELIKTLNPDILIKGADYTPDT